MIKSRKVLDYNTISPINYIIPQLCKVVKLYILMVNISFAYVYGENKNKIISFLKTKNIPFLERNTLKEIIDNLIIEENIILLFSPGAPSFDQYSSYSERGYCFDMWIDEKIRKIKNA